MFSQSSKSVRITGISKDAKRESLETCVEMHCKTHAGQKWLCGCFPAPRRAGGDAIVSLAPQREKQTATISFPSKELKNTFPKTIPETDRNWIFDDEFNDLTVLYTAAQPKLDICAVHGLNGNAFDTWAWEEHMWLRDFLPAQLEESRVMTFGYSSRLGDSGNMSSLEEWAHGLLSAVSSVRESISERSRPIIFVCHSLGGLVAREAMIHLGRDPDLHAGISLKQCGLLFLATPHSGATAADTNPYLTQLAEVAGYRAVAITRLLEAFNTNSVIAKRDFGRLQPAPPYICVYETRFTPVGGRKIAIVRQDSAGLGVVTALPMNDVDHRGICRFPSDTHPGYIQVVGYLNQLWGKLEKAKTVQDKQDRLHDISAMALVGQAAVDTSNLQPSPPVGEAKQYGVIANHSIQAGDGQGGQIVNDGNHLIVGGGRATGATMNLRDLKNFTGIAEGGRGAGARILT